MKHVPRKYLPLSLKIAAVLCSANGLSGCIVAMPPAVQAASFALDGISYAATGKSVTDHALSAMANKDCAMARALNGEKICTANALMAELNAVDGRLNNPNAEIIAKSITPAQDDAAFQRASLLLTNTGDQDADEVLDDDQMDFIDMQVAQGPML